MSRPIAINLYDEERRTLTTIVRSPSAQAREVLRARIILTADEGLGPSPVTSDFGDFLQARQKKDGFDY